MEGLVEAVLGKGVEKGWRQKELKLGQEVKSRKMQGGSLVVLKDERDVIEMKVIDIFET